MRDRGDPGATRQGRAVAGDVKAALELEQAWRRCSEGYGRVFRRELWRLGPGRTGKRRLEQRGRRLRLLEVRPGRDGKVAEIGEDKIRNLRPVCDGVGRGCNRHSCGSVGVAGRSAVAGTTWTMR